MNIDSTKLMKSAAILLLVFVVVIGLSKIIEHNSLTLTEYANKHPEFTNNKPVHDSDESSESSIETEILQNEVEPTPTSTLTGAILNASIPNEQRITYTDSFYIEPLSDNLRRYITGVSFPSIVETIDTIAPEDTALETPQNSSMEYLPDISYEELRYVHILHYDFEGKLAEGELICNESIAEDLVKIFYELYRNEYQLEKVRLIDEYDGDDYASMEDNNTSCFNYRTMAEGSSLSKHALGLAIDINPFYNPYITYNDDGSENVFPSGSEAYANRDAAFPYKIDENDLCYKLFTAYGFTWGGNWNSCKDYQHFQKTPN